MNKIVISSGHGKYVAGAVGIMDEVTENRRVVEQVAVELRHRGTEVVVFHDDVSKSQEVNLETIVSYHNAQKRDLDVSVHFNAFKPTTEPRGTECFFVTQEELASDISDAIASCGLIDRGPKIGNDLYFLNHTKEPAILIEVCFVDSQADCEVYKKEFENICARIANVLSGGKTGEAETV